MIEKVYIESLYQSANAGAEMHLVAAPLVHIFPPQIFIVGYVLFEFPLHHLLSCRILQTFCRNFCLCSLQNMSKKEM